MEDSECRDFIVYDDGSVIDYDVSEVDAKNIADGCIDDWRDAAAYADGWSEEVENTFVALVTHRSVMINDRDATEEDYVGPDCTRVCDYELQPTAEWSRILQIQKEHEWMKYCLVSMGVLYGESGDLCRFVGENNDTLQRIAEEDVSIFPQAVGYSERISMKEIERLKKQIKLLKKHPNGGPGVNAIAAERLRQLESEGWWPEHDDKWKNGELIQAAATYVFAGALKEMRDDPYDCGWPWDIEWFKPFKEKEPENSYEDRDSYEVDRIRCLEKAGALIAAEIDRLKRKESKENGS